MNKKIFLFLRPYAMVLPALLLSAAIFNSCKIYQPTYFFKDIQRDTVITGFVTNDLQVKIRPNDQLFINISSLSPEDDLLFNRPVVAGNNPEGLGYTVNKQGNIYMHKLGAIPVTGLTRMEVKSLLEKVLLPYLKDPIASVSFANHRITVLGENNAMVVNMPEEKISILEVMATSKGVTLNSQLSRIMVIREKDNTKEIKHLNLEDPSIFTSPWYYLEPNDVVVVKPNQEKIEAEQKRIRNQLMYTTIITGITFVFLMIDRIIR